MVIVSHTPELVDGDRHRELLTRLFGTISFGELAVDSFFIISGYLIVASFVRSGNWRSYIRKRCSRIYPGFVVASLISLFVVAPIVGSSLSIVLSELPRHIITIALLQYLEVPGTFPHLAYANVNGAVWTIAYEFRCYLIAAALGCAGAFRRPGFIAIIAAGLMLCFILFPAPVLRNLVMGLPASPLWIGRLDVSLRLTAIFLAGSLFYLWRDRIVFSAVGVTTAAMGLLMALATKVTAEAGMAVFGGYLIFAFAACAGGTMFARINDRNDISYGTYLYGWPIGGILLTSFPAMSLPLIAIMTMVLSMAAGWASWHYVEKPAMRMFNRKIDHTLVAMPAIMR